MEFVPKPEALTPFNLFSDNWENRCNSCVTETLSGDPYRLYSIWIDFWSKLSETTLFKIQSVVSIELWCNIRRKVLFKIDGIIFSYQDPPTDVNKKNLFNKKN